MGRGRVVLVVVALTLTACGGGAEEAGPPDAASPVEADSPDDPTAAPPGSGEPATGSGAFTADPDALYRYPPVDGATLRYTSEVFGDTVTQDVTVTGVTTEGDGVTVAATSVVTDSNGETVTIDAAQATAGDGGLINDPSAFVASGSGFEITGSGPTWRIPPVAELEGGATSEGTTYAEFRGQGIEGRADYTYRAHGAGWETVEVPAGSFRAYVIVVEVDIDHSVFGRQSMTTTTHFVPGYAVVRSASVIGGTTITEELVSASVTAS